MIDLLLSYSLWQLFLLGGLKGTQLYARCYTPLLAFCQLPRSPPPTYYASQIRARPEFQVRTGQKPVLWEPLVHTLCEAVDHCLFEFFRFD